ncbi:MAG TPA: hypothetical protein VM533_19720 [Fimbriiglobus sp.]|jgi:hypothetical protein|nr:hypothetical protein [Fimbriiglobus sp.]
MQITLYQRTYPVKDAPVALSLVPHDRNQRHTFTVGEVVYEAECKELLVVIPDDAKIDPLKNLVSWGGDDGRVFATAKEVFELARAGKSGFRMAK